MNGDKLVPRDQHVRDRMGQKNPILHIFNQGAGGNSHIMKMIVECRSKESGCFNGA